MQSHLDFFLVCLKEILGPLPASLLPSAPSLLSEGGLCSDISCSALAPRCTSDPDPQDLSTKHRHPAEPLSRPQCISKSTSHTHPLPYTFTLSILLWRHTGPWRTPTSPFVRQLSAGPSPWPARAGRFWSPGQHHEEPSNSPFYSRTPQIYFGRSSTYY